MLPKLIMSEQDIENELKKRLKNRRYTSRNNFTNKNIRHLTSWVRYLERLKEDEILDDKTFNSGIASVTSAFIINEINDRVYRVILRIFIPTLLKEISHDLEEG